MSHRKESRDSREAPFFDVEVEDGLVVIRAHGAFTGPDMARATEEAAQVIRQPGQRWNIITDFSDAAISDREANQVLTRYVKANRPFVRKSAVLGLSGVKRFLFDLVVRFSGRSDLRPFKDEALARVWLAEHLPDE